MRRLLDNSGLKLASLGLAVALWFGIAGEKSSEMGLTVPVELQNFPKEMELTGETVNSLEVRLRASPGIIQRLQPGEISAVVDLAGAEEGERIVHLTPESIRAPFGVTVVRINPSMLTLNLERTLRRTLPIRPRLLGAPAAGFEVTDVAARPASVEVSGPRSRLVDVASAFTEPVDIDGAHTSVTRDVTLGLEDPILRIEGSTRVEVTARIREARATRRFSGLVLGVRGGTGRARPATIDVVVEGPGSVVERVAAEQVRPYVDLTGVAVGHESRLPVAVELAPGLAGVKVRETRPSEVSIDAAGGR